MLGYVSGTGIFTENLGQSKMKISNVEHAVVFSCLHSHKLCEIGFIRMIEIPIDPVTMVTVTFQGSSPSAISDQRINHRLPKNEKRVAWNTHGNTKRCYKKLPV